MKEVIIIIIPLIGVLIGWGCTEVSRHFTNSYQKKQTLNSALFMLLELYHQIKRVAVGYEQYQEYTRWYINLCAENEVPDGVKKLIEEALDKVKVPIISSTVSGDIHALRDDYETALKKLSCYYPVAAYRLRGRADVKRIVIDLDTIIKEIGEQLPMQISEYEGIASPLQSFLQSTVIQDHLSVLREEIIELAKSTSRVQRKEILQALDNIDEPDATLNEYMDLVKQQVLVMLNNQE